MSATTVLAPPDVRPTRLSGARIALVTVAIVVLLAASFVIGRATGSNAESTSSHPARPTATTAVIPVPAAGAGTPVTVCHMGRAC